MFATPDYSKVIINIRSELRNYLTTAGLKSVVVGLSGGIDSAVCTALAEPVCKELKLPLIGRSITIETNKPDEIDRSIAIGEAYCTDFREVNLTELYLNTISFTEEEALPINPDRETRIRLGNIKARLRMVYLYNLAQKHKGFVLSTDNYTELLLGFWTLHGDVGDYGMIQNLWKTEVYELSQHMVNTESIQKKAISLQRCIDAVPTDGLGITNSDLDQLGAKSYLEVDSILKEYIRTGNNSGHAVIARNIASEYKRKNPYNLSRDLILGNN